MKLDMGSKGDVARRRDIVADIILSYLTNRKQPATRPTTRNRS
ncbi:MAG: hypothetical protein ACJ8G5_01760 [Burkholderiales bacterium]